jgi:hypothetical protein
MNFGIRYILLGTFNCLALMGSFLIMILMKWDLTKRLVDLDVANNKEDAMMLFFLLGVMVIGFIGNVLLISLPDSKRRPAQSKHDYWLSSNWL